MTLPQVNPPRHTLLCSTTRRALDGSGRFRLSELPLVAAVARVTEFGLERGEEGEERLVERGSSVHLGLMDPHPERVEQHPLHPLGCVVAQGSLLTGLGDRMEDSDQRANLTILADSKGNSLFRFDRPVVALDKKSKDPLTGFGTVSDAHRERRTHIGFSRVVECASHTKRKALGTECIMQMSKSQ